MRKFALFFLACALLLTACANTSAPNPPEELPAPRTGGAEPLARPALPAGAAAQTDLQALEAPPELTVSTINQADHTTASCGSYQWTRQLPDGSASVIACGPHPLEMAEESNLLYTAFPPGSLPPLEEGQLPGMLLPVYYLDFGEIPPETVSARRWPSSCAGESLSEDAEDVIVELENGVFTLYPFGDGEFIYEICGEWGETGSACYVFHTLPQVRGAEGSGA